MDRAQKAEAVKELEAIFDGAGSVVMAEYSGMTVAEMEELRAKLREQGASIRVVKNRLAFAKDNEAFGIIGGFMGEEVFDISGIEALSKLPSREELIGMAAQRLLGQASQVAQRLMSPGSALSGAISVIEEKAAA